MNAGSFLKRTKETNLSEEELLILDVLFDARDRFESLMKENYATWHNLPYSHNLETNVLRDLINRLVENGILSSHPSDFDGRIFYGLTEAGGKLWEVERVPDWERYCTDYSTEDETGQWMLSVESPAAATAQAFMDCAAHCRLYRFKQDEIRTTTLIEEKPSIVYWKTFSTVYSMSVPMNALMDANQVDWQEYERSRSWWRTLTELGKFQVL
jgi:DNA-binding HxlR family transcriptional regulator